MSTAPLDIEAVKKVLEHHKMLENCDGIVAAVSGGCDSSVLLHVLWRLSTEMGLKILCAHINHNLRGSESERDEAFVRSLCEKYGIDCITRAKKPFSKGIRECLNRYEIPREQCALAGDQIFTDTLGGNCAGVRTILVRAIHNHTFWLKLRHVAELPFIYLAKNRRI